MTKTDLIFPAFSSRFVDFAVQFLFRCKFLFHEKWRASQVWQCMAWFFSNNHNCLLRIETNEIASFCIDHILRQMVFFHLRYSGQRPAFALCWRRSQNVVRTSVTHSAIASCATFLFLPHFDVICDLFLNRRSATWNLSSIQILL